MKTVQLRRYQFANGDAVLFAPWFERKVPGLRATFGFAVEWAYVLPETDEFVWAVSYPGTEAEFLAAEQVYMVSPERAETFADVPGETPIYNNHLVQILFDAKP